MDNPDLIEMTESEFRFLIEKAHRSGLTYGRIFAVLADIVGELISRAEAEFWLMQHNEAGK